MTEMDTYTKPLACLGLLAVVKIALSLTRQATLYLRPSTLVKSYNPTGTNWALVTGATNGIGYGFAQELCARGFKVILHGRNAGKLERRQRELQAEFPNAQLGIVVRDAQHITGDIDDVDGEVRRIVGAASLTVLVNNVGGETRPGTLLKEYTFGDIQDTLSRNAAFTIQITRVLARLLEENAPSLVLNVSSVCAFGLPYVSAYSVTKGFLDAFTNSLRAEFQAEGKAVNVMGLRVGGVKTPGHDVKSTLFVPEGRTMAAAGLDRVGCGEEIVWAYFWHWLQGLSFKIFPRWLMLKLAGMKLQALRADMLAKTKSS